MAIRAVVFDFDGLILETEEPIYLALREVCGRYGIDLTMEMYSSSIGTGTDADGTFDAVAEMNARGGSYTTASLWDELRPRIDAIVDEAEVLPGVLEWVGEAEAAGLGVAIASSSPRHWIEEHLGRLGHVERFPVVCCYDDVNVHKPEPHVYLHACERLGVAPADAVAVEDSVNGLRSAKAAGLRCVAVPTLMTRHLDFSEADVVLDSLADASLADVLSCLG